MRFPSIYQPDMTFLSKMRRLRKIKGYFFQYLDDDARRQLTDIVVGILLELQKEDGEDREVVMHWAVHKSTSSPTVVEKRTLRAPRPK